MALADVKTVGGGFSNEAQYVRVVYDFGVDTGAIKDYDILVSDGSCLVELVNMDFEVAGTSGGASVMDVGKDDGGTQFKSDLAVASMTLDAQIASDNPGTIVELADGEKIVMGIEAATLTAGKIVYLFRVYKR